MKQLVNKPKRFTLSLPMNVHEELTKIATERDVSVRDIVLICLKVGLLAMSLEKSQNKELIIKEIINGKTKETKLILI